MRGVHLNGELVVAEVLTWASICCTDNLDNNVCTTGFMDAFIIGGGWNVPIRGEAHNSRDIMIVIPLGINSYSL